MNPEQEAREKIDAQLAESGWIVQSWDEMDVLAGEIVEDLESALDQIRDILADLDQRAGKNRSCRLLR